MITDHAAPGIDTMDEPAHLAPDDTLLGLAYDPFTDHFFLRLAPGNQFRVVDRPDRSIKREFAAPKVPADGGGDLAIRSRDRHLFLSHATQPALIEITLHGRFVRTIRLAGQTAPPRGVAYNQSRHHLYILREGDPRSVQRFDLDGHDLGRIELAHDVWPHTLAFDSDAQEFYAQLRANHRIGVFSFDGRLLRTLENPSPTNLRHFDVGPRSFLRLF